MQRRPRRRRLGLSVLSIAGAVGLTACDGGGELEPREVTLSAEERSLAERTSLDEAAILVIKSFGRGNVERLRGYDDLGDAAELDGVTIGVPEDRTEAVIERLSLELGPRGYRAYVHERNYGFEPDRIAVLTDPDPWTYVAMMGTNGINHDVMHEDVVRKLRDWDRRYGIEIVGASFDWVEVRFRRLPRDLEAFAREVYEFCPDSVEQGVGSLGALEREIEGRRGVFLWWD